MKQYVLTLIVAILSVACHDNKKICYSNDEQLLKVSPCIEDAFYYFLKHENETPDTDFVYSIDFMKGFPGLSDCNTPQNSDH